MRYFAPMIKTVAVLLLLSACDGVSSDTNERPDIVLTKTEQALTNDANRFAFDLFRQIAKEDKNFFISPLSASLALSMTANGAAGGTALEMKDVLGFGAYSFKDMNAYFEKMCTALPKADKLTETGIANSIWIRNGFPVLDSFKETVRSYYLAEIANLDFSSPAAVKTINDWCASKTNGKIDTIIEEIPAQMIMYLINALYFNGTWTLEFSKDYSYDGPFMSEQGSSTITRFMMQTGEFAYTANDYFAIAELPYGNEAFSMVVLLPREGVIMDKALEGFTLDNWSRWLSGLSSSKSNLTVVLPKFIFKYEKDLIPTLQAMGMVLPFMEGAADFGNLSPVGGLYIGLVKQKTYIDVSEKGTEAAAVTIVGVEKTASGPDDPIPFIVNKPYFYLIREKSTGAILFMGRMIAPC